MPIVAAAVIAMRVATTGAGSGGPDAAAIEENNRGVGLMGQYEYGRALEVFQALVDRHPDWLDVRVNLATSLLNRQQAGDSERALAVLEEGMELDDCLKRADEALYTGKREGRNRIVAASPTGKLAS